MKNKTVEMSLVYIVEKIFRRDGRFIGIELNTDIAHIRRHSYYRVLLVLGHCSLLNTFANLSNVHLGMKKTAGLALGWNYRLGCDMDTGNSTILNLRKEILCQATRNLKEY
jgi:hypothetical protein